MAQAEVCRNRKEQTDHRFGARHDTGPQANAYWCSRRQGTGRNRRRHRPNSEQDRFEPADERDAGGDGAGDLQGLVRRFRPHPRQDGRPHSILGAGTLELFPDVLDNEDKPVGWNRGTLADVAESPRRSVNPTNVSENTPYIGLEHMPRRSIALSHWGAAGKVKSNKTQFHPGEILYGKLRPYFHKVGVASLEGICSTDIIIVVPHAQKWGAFTLACLSSDEFVHYTDRTSTGTKMPRTSWKTMAQYKICLPSEKVTFAFQSVVQPLLDYLSANIHETSTLAQTRDLLLPKLMSGEVRLRDAEKAVGAVA